MTKVPVCKVLQVVTILDPGGLENFVMNVYRNIDRTKVQFDFLVHRERRGVYEDEIERLGGHIYRVPRANPLNPHYFRALDEFFSTHSYDAVHVHLDCMSAFVLRAARKRDIPIRIAHAHNSSQDKDIKYPIKLACKRLISRYATHLFACGEQAGEWMFNGHGFSIIPNAVDLNKFEFDGAVRVGVREELDIPSNALLIGHVGRFDRVKNHAWIIRVFAEVLKRDSNAWLVLVGDGGLKSNCELLTERLGVSSHVIFTGIRNDVNSLMSAMDIFLMPSFYEGLPVVLVEAQASGLPCLISDTLPTDCDLSDLITRLSLRSNPSIWASAIEGCVRRSGRSDYVDLLYSRGFDIGSLSHHLQQLYLQGESAV